MATISRGGLDTLPSRSGADARDRPLEDPARRPLGHQAARDTGLAPSPTGSISRFARHVGKQPAEPGKPRILLEALVPQHHDLDVSPVRFRLEDKQPLLPGTRTRQAPRDLCQQGGLPGYRCRSIRIEHTRMGVIAKHGIDRAIGAVHRRIDHRLRHALAGTVAAQLAIGIIHRHCDRWLRHECPSVRLAARQWMPDARDPHQGFREKCCRSDTGWHLTERANGDVHSALIELVEQRLVDIYDTKTDPGSDVVRKSDQARA